MLCRKCSRELAPDWICCPYCATKISSSPRPVRTRGNGMGYVYKRGTTWYARITLGFVLKPNGQKVQKFRTKGGFRTKTEALSYLPSLKNVPVRSSSIKFIELYQQWLPAYEPTVGKTTMDGHKAAFKYFEPIHFREFAQMVTSDFQQCIDACDKGKRTKENMKALITALYKYAVSNDYVDKDYAKYLNTGKEKKGTRNPIPLADVARIQQAVGTIPYADYTLCLIYTGFRPNEMLTLKKSSYDREHDCFVWGFKTEAGRNRIVTISPKIKPIIERQMHSDSEYLFPKPDGTLMDDEYFRKRCFVPLMNALGIEGCVPYSCRHTFSNLLKNVTGSDTDKAELMGHADASMTKYYQSADYQSLKRITDLL